MTQDLDHLLTRPPDVEDRSGGSVRFEAQSNNRADRDRGGRIRAPSKTDISARELPARSIAISCRRPLAAVLRTLTLPSFTMRSSTQVRPRKKYDRIRIIAAQSDAFGNDRQFLV